MSLFLYLLDCLDLSASNAANLTDGLDGLATVPVMLGLFHSHLFLT